MLVQDDGHEYREVVEHNFKSDLRKQTRTHFMFHPGQLHTCFLSLP